MKRHTSIPAAAKLMRHNHVGSPVVVVDLDDRVPVGFESREELARR